MADEEKEEDATGKQRQKFADDGNVAQSKDIVSLAVLVGGVSAILIMFPTIGGVIGGFARHSLGDLGQPIDGTLLDRFAFTFVRMLTPIVISVAVLAIAAQSSQTGIKFNTKLLEPKIDKLINPLPGLKKIFASKEALTQILMSSLKVMAVGTICAITIIDWLKGFLLGEAYTFGGLLGGAGEVALRVLIRVAITFLLLAAADFAVNKYKLEQQMKMSKQEVKDEGKNSDGNPEIKGKRRQMAMELLQQRSVANVPQADVVVVNPTHFAVALMYKPGEMDAPRVVAKGTDQLAKRIREIARQNGIPVVSQPPLARALYKQVKVGKSVPEDLFQAVASVLAYVYRARKGHKAA